MIKRLFITTIILLCLFLLPMTSVCAFANATGEEYLLVNKVGIKMYRKDSPTSLADAYFTLPNTYYVKKLTDSDYFTDKDTALPESYYYVEYNGQRGLVEKSNFSTASVTTVNAPYLNATIALNKNTSLYRLLPGSVSSLSIDLSVTDKVTFISYQQADDGTYWYYVQATVDSATQNGYVAAADTTDGDIPTTYLAHPNSRLITGEEKTDTPMDTDVSNNLLNTLLAIGTMVPVIVLMTVIFKPKKQAAAPKSKQQ